MKKLLFLFLLFSTVFSFSQSITQKNYWQLENIKHNKNQNIRLNDVQTIEFIKEVNYETAICKYYRVVEMYNDKKAIVGIYIYFKGNKDDNPSFIILPKYENIKEMFNYIQNEPFQIRDSMILIEVINILMHEHKYDLDYSKEISN